jgi:transcription initiation factor IIE alpha subunit
MDLIKQTLSTQFEHYTFCPKCGVDVTIFSHEGDCPCYH